MSASVPAFFFPTTVVIVDDSADFLANVSLHLPASLAVQTMTSPMEALIAINGGHSANAALKAAFTMYDNRAEATPNQHVIAIRLDAITAIMADPQRFSTVSVVVVDYDMPTIDGLEFCRNLRNPAIRKILLTGKADEHLAVDAFNEGLIDRFIRKQAPDAMPTLMRAIEQLQHHYIERTAHTLSDTLTLGPQRFLSDPAFHAEFARLCKALGIVEHYLVCDPESLLLVNAEGRLWRLVVMDDDALQAYAEIAQALEAPAELVSALSRGELLPSTAFDAKPAPRTRRDWQGGVRPAQSIPTAQRPLYYTVVDDPQGIAPAGLFTYSRYLAELDARLA